MELQVQCPCHKPSGNTVHLDNEHIYFGEHVITSAWLERKYETSSKYFQYLHPLLTFPVWKRARQHSTGFQAWCDCQMHNGLTRFPISFLPLFLLGLDARSEERPPITRAGLCVQWRLCGPREGFSRDPNGSLCLHVGLPKRVPS